MAKIGSLEVRTIGNGVNRIKVVKLPGHEFPIEHFLPENHETTRIDHRVTFIRSKLDTQPTFIKKASWPRFTLRLEPTSELRLARHINSLNIPNVRAEEPLAAILHSGGKSEVIYRKVFGPKSTAKEPLGLFPAKVHLLEPLRKHGIFAYDPQFAITDQGITLFDLEFFIVTRELKKRLKLKYRL